MVGVCCGCIAKPASVQPRKTYNILIGQLFAGEPIRTDEAIDSSIRRKIQKLQEYVQVNPAKIPKVSRRLMRRIKANLLRPVNNLGWVKISVHTYIYLLACSTNETSSYSPSFFARELVSGPDPVVPMLLRDIHIEMRTLGAELLAVFTKVQQPVDSKLDAIQVHIPQVCRAAQAALSAGRKEQRLQDTVERRRQGDKLAVPNPIDLVARRDPAHVAALEVACLRCLAELVALCQRNKVLPKHLTAIQAVMLDSLRVRDKGHSRGGSEAMQSADGSGFFTPAASFSATGAVTAAAAPTARTSTDSSTSVIGLAAAPGVVDFTCYKELGIAGAVPAGSSAKQLAGQLLSLMGSFTRDIATVHTILDSFYEYLDEQHRWQDRSVVRELLAMLSASGSQHQFPIYASFLRHASSKRLALQDCALVLSLAAEKGAALDDCYSLAALALALHEVPRAWAQQAGRETRTMPLQALMDLLRIGPAKDIHAQHINAGAGAADGPFGSAVATAATIDDSGLAGPGLPGQSESLITYPSVGQAAPAAAVAAPPSVTDKSDIAAFKEQLAQVREAMLAAVRLLAMRIGTAAEICEAVTGALAAAAAELGLTSQSDESRAGASASLFAGVLTKGTGVGSAATPAAAAEQLTGQSGKALEAAAAAMMLQCAIAATDAFVTQCTSAQQRQHVGQAVMWLPGGVLPASLVEAALPLLRAPSALIRRPVQRILLALVPAACKGLPSEKLSADLAEVTIQNLQHILHSSSSSGSSVELSVDLDAKPDDVLASRLADTDSLLRACLAGAQSRPSAALQVAQLLLHQHAGWAKNGYRSAGNGSVACAHAMLLLVNSLMTALAAIGCTDLLSLQLALDPLGCHALTLTSTGLQPTGARFDAAASEAALATLQQQQPATAQQGQALKDELLRAPLLVREYGDQLPLLLEEHITSQPSMFSEKGGERPQLAGKVNALLMKRMSTLRRDLVHVSELMRDSITRLQDTPSAASVARVSDSGAAPTGARRLSVDADAAAAGVSSGSSKSATVATFPAVAVEMVNISSSGLELKRTACSTAATALPGRDESSPVESPASLPGIAKPADASTSQQYNGSVHSEHILIEGLQQQQWGGTLSAAVAAALQQPIPPEAYVVKDVKISRLAGELEPVT